MDKQTKIQAVPMKTPTDELLTISCELSVLAKSLEHDNCEAALMVRDLEDRVDNVRVELAQRGPKTIDVVDEPEHDPKVISLFEALKKSIAKNTPLEAK